MKLPVISSLALAIATLSGTAFAADSNRAFWRGQWVKYEVVDGYAITQGDIKIGPVAEVREFARMMERGQQQTAVMQKALTIESPTNLWNLRDASGAVIVPYSITTPSGNIQPAVDEVNRLLAGVLKWIPRTTETDYVDFNLATAGRGACASFVGRRGGKQEITGDPTCGVGTLVHEMGHAMGLWHSQMDATANAFVEFRLQNMEAASRFNNQPVFNARTLSGYDYASIMHYQRTAFSASSADRITLETKPAGMILSPLSTYSAGDLDGLFRLYGRTPQQVTVQTNPPGIRVIVDGVAVTTPASFTWPVGSIHRIWVEDGIVTREGFRHAFGRWSHDFAAVPSSQLTWQVKAGDGAVGQPSDAPSDTLLTANFVRLIDVQPTATVQAGGNVTITPERAPWPGTASLFPQFTSFKLDAQPASGFENFFTWGSAIGSRGGAGVRRTITATITGNVPSQTIGAGFHNGPTLAIDVVGAGTEDGLTLRVTPPGGTASNFLAPRIDRNTLGSWKYELLTPQTVGTSIRYAFDSYEGFDDPSGLIAMPDTGVRRAAVRVAREVKPYKSVEPTCAGAITLSNTADWIRTGSPLTVTLATNNVGIFAGWTGTLSGTNLTNNITVGSNVPEFVANFNTINEVLSIESVSPGFMGDDSQNLPLIVRGSGFTPQSQLWIGSAFLPSTYIDSKTIRAQISRGLVQTGRQPIYIRNVLSSSCANTTDTLAIDVLPAGQTTTAVMTEFYNPDLDYYFFTSRAVDKQILDARSDWRRTGQEFKLFARPSEGALPFERFFFANAAKNGARGTHFYTSIGAEQRYLTTFNTKNEPLRALPYLEGIEGYTIDKLANGSCPSQTIPVYRAFRGAPRYNDDANHRFSTSLAQHQDMVNRLGWTDEGVAFCAVQ